MNPTSISAGRDGEMGAQMGKYGRNKQKKRSDKLHWNSRVPRFRSVPNFLPVLYSLSLFLSGFVLEKKRLCDEYRARGNNMAFQT